MSKQVADYLRDSLQTAGAVLARLQNVELAVTKLERIVTTGNGQKSVLSQITGAELTINEIKTDINELRLALARIEKQYADNKSTTRTLWVTLVAAFLAAIGGIIAAMISSK